MKILIIGSEGFIGKHCVNFFMKQGYDVHGCDLRELKISDYTYFKISRFDPDFADLFKNEKFDICINAAGSGSVPRSMTHPYQDFEANTVDTFHILEAIRNYNLECGFINISSAAVYGNPVKLPVSEIDQILPLSPYGWHKYYSELICKEYNFLYGIRSCSIRPFSVYGPGLQKQLFWDLFKKTQNASELILYGTGLESRDFIYIEDLVQAINLLIENNKLNGENYNIGSGRETLIQEVVNIYFKILDPKITYSFGGEKREGDPLNWKADISKIISLGFEPKISLQLGLEKYVKWLQEK